MLLPGGTALPAPGSGLKLRDVDTKRSPHACSSGTRASDCGHLRQIASFRHLPIRKPRAQRHQDDSDWDLLVASPDDAPDGLFDPMRGWQLQRDIGIPATILTVRSTDLAECWDVPNTLGLWWPGKGVCWMSRARTIASDLRLAAENVNDARLLLEIGSRNAAYLASPAAEHVIRAVATSEDLHIERKDAHRLDTTVRRIPDSNPDKPALSRLTLLEIFATACRCPSPSGRISEPPSFDPIDPAQL